MVRKSADRYLFTTIRERMRDHGGKVLNFAVGEHSEELSESVLELTRENAHLALRRGTTEEITAFSESASAMLAREYSVSVPPRSILPVPSGRAAMSALAASLLAPGDGVLVTEPGYPVFDRLAAQQNARVLTAFLDPGQEFSPDLKTLSPDEVSSIRLAALNYPNNPTGAVISSRTISALRDALAPGTVLFNDAIYGPLVYDRKPTSLLDSRWQDGELLELHSLSKIFQLGPLGISFLAGTDSLIQTVRNYTEFAGAPLSSLQFLVTRFCLEDARSLQDMRARYSERITRLRETLAEIGFQAHPTPSGLYVLCHVPAAIRDRPVAGAQQATDVLLDEYGLAVVAWETPLGGYLRFSSLYCAEDLEALARLGSDRKLVSA